MKTLVLIVGVLACTAIAEAGPSTPSRTFNQSITRQDFTGQGTYHRLGLIREQDRALATRGTSTSPQHPARKGWLARLWNTLFPPRNRPDSPTP
jgi:hypothetical protein